MYNSVVRHIAHHIARQEIPAQVRYSDVSCPSGSIARTARAMSPNLSQNQSGIHFMSLADGDD